MKLREANSEQVSPPARMRSAKVEGLLVERLLEARALAPAQGVAVLEPSLAEPSKALPEARDRAVRKPKGPGDLGKRLAPSMASDDLLADRLGNGGGHRVPPGDLGLQVHPTTCTQPCGSTIPYTQHYSGRHLSPAMGRHAAGDKPPRYGL
jgi:hypothetical protein